LGDKKGTFEKSCVVSRRKGGRREKLADTTNKPRSHVGVNL